MNQGMDQEIVQEMDPEICQEMDPEICHEMGQETCLGMDREMYQEMYQDSMTLMVEGPFNQNLIINLILGIQHLNLKICSSLFLNLKNLLSCDLTLVVTANLCHNGEGCDDSEVIISI